MNEIPNFWDVGPHAPIPVEKTFHEFVRNFNGKVVADILSGSPGFENADYLFEEAEVVAELKEVETEFLNSNAAQKGLEQLLERLTKESPDWKPSFLGGNSNYPSWFQQEFIRLSRPPITRILKKANRQIKATKEHFKISSKTGVLLFVNDGFTGLAPDLVQAVICDALLHSYSSIDCIVYLTVNRYIEIRGSNELQLIWAPTYSERSDESLVEFIDDLGRQWVDHLESKIGNFTSKTETPKREIILGSKSIVLPNENRG